MASINRDFFYYQVRRSLFDGKLRASQVAGLSVLLDYWDTRLSKRDDRWLAYALATAHHETGRTMQPIAERGGNEYKRRLYDITGFDPVRARANGNTMEGDGVLYAGRGYVQLTWKNNYRRAGTAVGENLLLHPDRAMAPAVAAPILFEGMIGGWFTGRKLADYFSPSQSRWSEARRIINGKDKADLIKGFGLQYYAAISYTT